MRIFPLFTSSEALRRALLTFNLDSQGLVCQERLIRSAVSHSAIQRPMLVRASCTHRIRLQPLLLLFLTANVSNKLGNLRFVKASSIEPK